MAFEAEGRDLALTISVRHENDPQGREKLISDTEGLIKLAEQLGLKLVKASDAIKTDKLKEVSDGFARLQGEMARIGQVSDPFKSLREFSEIADPISNKVLNMAVAFESLAEQIKAVNEVSSKLAQAIPQINNALTDSSKEAIKEVKATVRPTRPERKASPSAVVPQSQDYDPFSDLEEAGIGVSMGENKNRLSLLMEGITGGGFSAGAIDPEGTKYNKIKGLFKKTQNDLANAISASGASGGSPNADVLAGLDDEEGPLGRGAAGTIRKSILSGLMDTVREGTKRTTFNKSALLDRIRTETDYDPNAVSTSEVHAKFKEPSKESLSSFSSLKELLPGIAKAFEQSEISTVAWAYSLKNVVSNIGQTVAASLGLQGSLGTVFQVLSNGILLLGNFGLAVLSVGIVAGGLVKTLYDMAAGFTAATLANRNSALAAGTNSEAWDDLKDAFAMSGVGSENLDKVLAQMDFRLKDAFNSITDTSGALATLGISAYKQNGTLKDSSEIFLEIVENSDKLGTGAARSAKLMELFGRSGSQVAAIFDIGKEKLLEYIRVSDMFDDGMKKSDEAQAVRFNMNQTILGKAAEGAGNMVKRGLMPSMNAGLESLTGGVMSSWKATFGEGGIGAAAGAETMKTIFTAISPIITAFSGVLQVLASVVAVVVSGVGLLVTAFKPLLEIFGNVGSALIQIAASGISGFLNRVAEGFSLVGEIINKTIGSMEGPLAKILQQLGMTSPEILKLGKRSELLEEAKAQGITPEEAKNVDEKGKLLNKHTIPKNRFGEFIGEDEIIERRAQIARELWAKPKPVDPGKKSEFDSAVEDIMNTFTGKLKDQVDKTSLFTDSISGPSDAFKETKKNLKEQLETEEPYDPNAGKADVGKSVTVVSGRTISNFETPGDGAIIKGTVDTSKKEGKDFKGGLSNALTELAGLEPGYKEMLKEGGEKGVVEGLLTQARTKALKEYVEAVIGTNAIRLNSELLTMTKVQQMEEQLAMKRIDLAALTSKKGREAQVKLMDMDTQLGIAQTENALSYKRDERYQPGIDRLKKLKFEEKIEDSKSELRFAESKDGRNLLVEDATVGMKIGIAKQEAENIAQVQNQKLYMRREELKLIHDIQDAEDKLAFLQSDKGAALTRGKIISDQRVQIEGIKAQADVLASREGFGLGLRARGEQARAGYNNMLIDYAYLNGQGAGDESKKASLGLEINITQTLLQTEIMRANKGREITLEIAKRYQNIVKGETEIAALHAINDNKQIAADDGRLSAQKSYEQAVYDQAKNRAEVTEILKDEGKWLDLNRQKTHQQITTDEERARKLKAGVDTFAEAIPKLNTAGVSGSFVGAELKSIAARLGIDMADANLGWFGPGAGRSFGGGGLSSSAAMKFGALNSMSTGGANGGADWISQQNAQAAVMDAAKEAQRKEAEEAEKDAYEAEMARIRELSGPMGQVSYELDKQLEAARNLLSTSGAEVQKRRELYSLEQQINYEKAKMEAEFASSASNKGLRKATMALTTQTGINDAILQREFNAENQALIIEKFRQDQLNSIQNLQQHAPIMAATGPTRKQEYSLQLSNQALDEADKRAMDSMFLSLRIDVEKQNRLSDLQAKQEYMAMQNATRATRQAIFQQDLINQVYDLQEKRIMDVATLNQRIALEQQQQLTALQEAQQYQAFQTATLNTRVALEKQTIDNDTYDKQQQATINQLTLTNRIRNAQVEAALEVGRIQQQMAINEATRAQNVAAVKIRLEQEIQLQRMTIDELREQLNNKDLLILKAKEAVTKELLIAQIDALTQGTTAAEKLRLGFDQQVESFRALYGLTSSTRPSGLTTVVGGDYGTPTGGTSTNVINLNLDGDTIAKILYNLQRNGTMQVRNSSLNAF
jgi:hypothetical protein